jgi:prefoldin subunit 5
LRECFVPLTYWCCFDLLLAPRFSGQHLQQKVPELGKSLTLVRSLLKKKEEGELGMARYSLADNIYAKAELDYSEGTVNLWLGANVMLEYTYEEAIEFLSKNEEKAKREFEDAKSDLGFVRDQIVTSEVNMSRIYNWDVRRKRTTKTSA